MRKISASLILSLMFIAGCASSTMGPGAGAVQATVKGGVEEVNKVAEQVFQEMNIQLTGSSIKNAGNERQLTGKMGDNDVTVILDNAPNKTTEVEVQASKNLVDGNKDLAKEILSRIVAQN